MSTKITEKTRVSTLRKLAKEADVKGWEEMERSELYDALTAPESSEDAPEGTVENVETPVETTEKAVEVPVGLGDGVQGVDRNMSPKAKIMKENLSNQPKVRIKIPLEQGEKPGMGYTKSVILNGYRMNIQKGIYVEVPQQIADVLGESEAATAAATNLPQRIDE